MKNASKIILFLFLFVLTGCDYSFTQPPAKVEYRLEDYYGYGDIQGPLKNGVPVIIEDVSKDNNYPVNGKIAEEEIVPVPKATQVYTVSDNIGPGTPEGFLVRKRTASDERSIDVSGQTHIVEKGETLFSISRQYDIPILPIIVVNSLEPPYSLNEGQQIKIPEGKFHTVREGETLYSISRKYGVDMSGIVKLNDLRSPYNLVAGQRLQIPFPSDLPSEEQSGSTEALAEVTINNQPAQREKYPSPAEDLSKPASLRHPTGGILGAYSQPQVPVTTSGQTEIDTEVETAKLQSVVQDNITHNEAKNDGKFMWPVKGNLVKRFGQQGSEYNDGINIAASSGTKVMASNSGRVVYTGNSLKSYGNLVIIKHDNGLLSAYAHLNDVIVKKDQKISKGQVIGTVGSTGKVVSPQLYFAIRKGKDAKNPMNYLQ